MPRRLAMTAILLVASLSPLTTPAAAAAEDFAFYHENVMGTSLELKVRADDIEAARWAEDRVLREIDRASAIFSGYDPTSEFSRWQAASPAGAGADLARALRSARVVRLLARPQRRDLRSPGASPDPALVVRRRLEPPPLRFRAQRRDQPCCVGPRGGSTPPGARRSGSRRAP